MRIVGVGFISFVLAWLVPLATAHAVDDIGELSLMGSYSKTNYGSGAYTTTKRYSATLGYNLTPVTEIEVSYTVTDSYFNYQPYQTNKVDEQALGLSLVQTLVPRHFYFQPYLKAGAAQYNRKQSSTADGIPLPESSTKSPSGLLGAGIRIYLLRNFSLKVEGVTFLPDLRIAEAKNNFSVQGGAGWSF